LVDQPSARLFRCARNQILMMLLPHVPVWWKARMICSMTLRVLFILLVRRPRRDLKAIRCGIRAGLRERKPSAIRILPHGGDYNSLALTHSGVDKWPSQAHGKVQI